ncbi:hypothetical protein SAMN05216567_115125 [Variovorax sp. OK605]|uniref:hypothetical protein n=1 Tax=Variovorax sp. OK605 TaxID=1855317 RepID=UPI0008DFC2BD|nr:hypothetical protein [Variovorax sp. OK605]SFQ40919.1 hypothetical protein SAMN05216567_115125 [Variovorax sp. OK605]
MAKRIMARRPTPAPPASATSAAATTAADTAGPSAVDLLESNLEQLRSLLWCCYGEGIEWTTGDGPKHLENVLWIAAELAREAAELFQECAAELQPAA